jgi:NitT/TauT family transport system substrate-binding protein
MRFNAFEMGRLVRSYPLRLFALAVGWLVLISALHYVINTDRETRQVVAMGYMPVITNLAAPLLDHASLQNENSVRFKAIKFSSFAEMAEALRNDDIQAAFIIAPLSIVLRQQGEDVKVVYIGNRNESTLVVRKALQVKSLQELSGRTIAVPMRYSGHNLGLLRLLAQAGLQDKIRVVEMNPPDMASALTSGSLDAYFVGEPFAAQTLMSGAADRLFYVEQIWPNFICNLVLVKEQFIQNNRGVVQQLVDGAVRSGLWVQQHPHQAAQIASRYWGQTPELVEYALNTPAQRIVFDQYTPKQAEMQQIADMMVRFGLLQKATVEGLVEDSFARQADLSGITELATILGKP